MASTRVVAGGGVVVVVVVAMACTLGYDFDVLLATMPIYAHPSKAVDESSNDETMLHPSQVERQRTTPW